MLSAQDAWNRARPRGNRGLTAFVLVGPLEARPSHTRSLDLHRGLPSKRPRPGPS